MKQLGERLETEICLFLPPIQLCIGPVQCKYYADNRYFAQSNGYAAYKGKKLPRILSDEKNMMAKQRVGVERFWKHLKQLVLCLPILLQSRYWQS